MLKPMSLSTWTTTTIPIAQPGSRSQFGPWIPKTLKNPLTVPSS